MEHKDIVQLVNSLEVAPLTRENFESFVQNANGLFLPEGTKFQEYFSPGYNDLSLERYDWGKGKPKWRKGLPLTFQHIEPKEIQKGGQIWINVHLDDATGVWGVRPNRKPLKFAFDSQKALYIAEQEGNGTPEQPWETLYVRLE